MAIVRQNNAEGLPATGIVTVENQGTTSGDVLTPFRTGSGAITAIGTSWGVSHGARAFVTDAGATGDNSFLYWELPWSNQFAIRAERRGLSYGDSGSGYVVGDNLYLGLMGFFVGSPSSPTWIADLRERSHYDSSGPDHFTTYWQLRDRTGAVVWESNSIPTYTHWQDNDGDTNSRYTLELKVDALSGLAGVRLYNNYYSLTTPIFEVSGIVGDFGYVNYGGQNVLSYFGKPAYLGQFTYNNGVSYDSLARSDTYDFIGTVDNPRVSTPITVGLVNTSIKQVLFTTGQLPINIEIADGSIYGAIASFGGAVTNSTTTTQKTIGMRFKSNKNQWSVGGRYYKSTGGTDQWNNKIVQMALFDADGGYGNGVMIAEGRRYQLASGSGTDPIGWIIVDWGQPVLLEAGKNYIVAVHPPSGSSSWSYPTSINNTISSSLFSWDSIRYLATTSSGTIIFPQDATIPVSAGWDLDVLVSGVDPVEGRQGSQPWLRKTDLTYYQAPTYGGNITYPFKAADGGNKLIAILVSPYGDTSPTPAGWTKLLSINKSSSEASMMMYTKTASDQESSFTIASLPPPPSNRFQGTIYEFPLNSYISYSTKFEDLLETNNPTYVSGLGSGSKTVFVAIASPTNDTPRERVALINKETNPWDQNYFISDPSSTMLTIVHVRNSLNDISQLTESISPALGHQVQEIWFSIAALGLTTSNLSLSVGLTATAKPIAKTTGSLPITVGLYHESPQTLFEYFGVTTTIFDSDYNFPTVGTNFTANVDLWSTGMQYYVTNVLGATHYAGKLLEGGLWDSTGNLIASGWVIGPASPTANEFRDIFWSAPARLKAGQTYTVGFRAPSVTVLFNKRPYATSTAIKSWSAHSNTLFSIVASSTWNKAATDPSDIAGMDYLVRPTGQFNTLSQDELAPIDISGQRNYPDQSSKAWVRNTTGTSYTGTPTASLNFQNAKAGNFLVAIMASPSAVTLTSDWFQQANIVGSTELSVWTKTAVAEENTISITQSGTGDSIAYEVLEFKSGSSWAASGALSGGDLNDNATVSGLSGTTAVFGATSMKLGMLHAGDTPTTLWDAPYVEIASVDAVAQTSVHDGVQLSVGLTRDNFLPTATPSSTTVSKYESVRDLLAFGVFVPTTAVATLIDVGLVNTNVATVLQAGTRTLPIGIELIGGRVSSVVKTTGSLPITVGLPGPAAKTVVKSIGSVSIGAGLINNTVSQARITSGVLRINAQLSSKVVTVINGQVPFNVGLSATARIFQTKTTGSLPLNIKLTSGISATIGKLPISAGLLTSTPTQIFRVEGSLPIVVSIASIAKPIVRSKGFVRVDVLVAGGNPKPIVRTSGALGILLDIYSDAARVVTTTGILPIDVRLKSTVNPNGPRKVVSVSAKPIVDVKNYSRSTPTRG